MALVRTWRLVPFSLLTVASYAFLTALALFAAAAASVVVAAAFALPFLAMGVGRFGEDGIVSIILGYFVALIGLFLSFVRVLFRVATFTPTLPGFDLTKAQPDASSSWYGHKVQSIRGSEWRQRLLDLVHDVCMAVGTRPFERVLVVTGAGLSTIYVAGEKCLVLGALAVRHLTVEELRAAIAHECAHHIDGAMALTAVSYRARLLGCFIGRKGREDKQDAGSLLRKIRLFRNSSYRISDYVHLLVASLLQRVSTVLFRLLSGGKEREFFCDAVASRAIGGVSMCEALHRISVLSAVWECLGSSSDGEPFVATVRPADVAIFLYRLDDFLGRVLSSDEYRDFRVGLFQMESPTHPSISSRVSRIGALSTFVGNGESLLDNDGLENLWIVCAAKNRAGRLFGEAIGASSLAAQVDLFGDSLFFEGFSPRWDAGSYRPGNIRQNLGFASAALQNPWKQTLPSRENNGSRA